MFPVGSFTQTFQTPAFEPAGTVNAAEVSLQLVGTTVPPKKVIANGSPTREEVPKCAPESVTDIPGGPDVGETLSKIGLGLTVKVIGLLVTPPTVTTTFPVVA